jgi:hypothetical protein
MNDRHLEAVILTVTNADPYLLPWMIRHAYEHGATLPQVLLAIDAGYCLSTEDYLYPPEVWATAHEWAWISRRLPPSRRSPRPN